MPCLIAAIALFLPRIAIIIVWLFSNYLGRAYETVLWPLLGFVFMPLTTLAYAWAHNSGGGSVSGFGLFIVILAALFDLGAIGGGAHKSRRRR